MEETTNAVMANGSTDDEDLSNCLVRVLIVAGQTYSQDQFKYVLNIINSSLERFGKAVASNKQEIVNAVRAHRFDHLDLDQEYRVWYSDESSFEFELLVNPSLHTVRSSLVSFFGETPGKKQRGFFVNATLDPNLNGDLNLKDSCFSCDDFSHLVHHHVKPAAAAAAVVKSATDQHLLVHVYLAPRLVESNKSWKQLEKHSVFKVHSVVLKETLDGQFGDFVHLIQRYFNQRQVADLLETPRLTGTLKATRPCLYIFPSGNGDSAYFNVDGYSMLINGGYERHRPSFWKFVSQFKQVDSVLITHADSDSLGGLTSFFSKKLATSQSSCETPDDAESIAMSSGNTPAVYSVLGNLIRSPISPAVKSVESRTDSDIILDAVDKLNINLVSLVKSSDNLLVANNSAKQSTSISNNKYEHHNLFNKIGYGSLDLYVLSPLRSSAEFKEFCAHQQANFARTQNLRNVYKSLPSSHLATSVCLLVWLPAGKNATALRLLFTGNVPQATLNHALDKLKDFEILSHPTYRVKQQSQELPELHAIIKEAPPVVATKKTSETANAPKEQKVTKVEKPPVVKNDTNGASSTTTTKPPIASKTTTTTTSTGSKLKSSTSTSNTQALAAKSESNDKSSGKHKGGPVSTHETSFSKSKKTTTDEDHGDGGKTTTTTTKSATATSRTSVSASSSSTSQTATRTSLSANAKSTTTAASSATTTNKPAAAAKAPATSTTAAKPKTEAKESAAKSSSAKPAASTGVKSSSIAAKKEAAAAAAATKQPPSGEKKQKALTLTVETKPSSSSSSETTVAKTEPVVAVAAAAATQEPVKVESEAVTVSVEQVDLIQNDEAESELKEEQNVPVDSLIELDQPEVVTTTTATNGHDESVSGNLMDCGDDENDEYEVKEEVRINSASSASLHQLDHQEAMTTEQHEQSHHQQQLGFDEEDSLQDSHHHCQQHQHSPNLSPVRKEFEQTNGHHGGSSSTTTAATFTVDGNHHQGEDMMMLNGGGDVVVEDVMTRSFIEDPTNPLSNPFNGSHNNDDDVEATTTNNGGQSAPPPPPHVAYLNDSNDLNRTHELSDDSEHHEDDGHQNGGEHHQNGNGNGNHHHQERHEHDNDDLEDLETSNYKSTLDTSASDKLINGIESLKLQQTAHHESTNGNGIIDSRSWNVLELPKPVNPSDSPAPPAAKSSTSGAAAAKKPLATPSSPSSPAQKPTAESKTASNNKTSQQSSNVIKAPTTPIAHVEVAYIPAHGNSNYVDVDFFKRVRAKHYILSCAEASEQVLNALLEAKETFWSSGEDKHQVVNLIPTYEWDSLKKWFVTNEERLAKAHIEIMPAACFAEVTMDSDPTSTCQAYKLEL